MAGAGATDRTVDDDEILLEEGETPVGHEDRTEGLLGIIERLFAGRSSKNVMQVGLSALVPLPSDSPCAASSDAAAVASTAISKGGS